MSCCPMVSKTLQGDDTELKHLKQFRLDFFQIFLYLLGIWQQV